MLFIECQLCVKHCAKNKECKTNMVALEIEAYTDEK